MSRPYTGVGSRKAPPRAIAQAEAIGEAMALRGFRLRSGAADGMDGAFERGCDRVQGPKEIFLPFKGFNGHRTGIVSRNLEEEIRLAVSLHPRPGLLKQTHLPLHGRNVNQVLGEMLNEPSEVLICWTPDAVMDHEGRTMSTGGTGTAISVASKAGIPVINLCSPLAFMLLPPGFEFLQDIIEGI